MKNTKFTKEQKLVVKKLIDAYHITKNMELNSSSGEAINEILVVAIERIKSIEFKPWSKNRMQNRALVEAAPEALEALESLLKLADAVMKRDGSVTDSIRDSARSVIAKARGES